MKIPVPCRANVGGLRVHGIIPSSHAKFEPSFRIHGKIDFPQPPRVVEFGRHVLVRNFIPNTSSVAGNFDTNGPMTTAGVSPSAHFDLAVVDNLSHVYWRHDGGRHGHVLDAETVAVHGVLLSDLGCVVEVFFRLDGGERGSADGFNFVEPFAGACSNVCYLRQYELHDCETGGTYIQIPQFSTEIRGSWEGVRHSSPKRAILR